MSEMKRYDFVVDTLDDMEESVVPVEDEDGAFVFAPDADAALAAMRGEVERLAGSLAACGVIAGCDDAESFNRWALSPDNPCWTDSLAAITRLRVEASKLHADVAALTRDAERWRLVETRGYEIRACVKRWGGSRMERVTVEEIDAALSPKPSTGEG